MTTTSAFRYSEVGDESQLKEILEETWMKESQFDVGVKISGHSISEALSLDRQAPVRTIVFENNKNEIAGTASITEWRPSQLQSLGIKADQRKFSFKYLADLRMGANADRNLHLTRRGRYRLFISELSENKANQPTSIILTSVLDENKLARKSLCSGRGGIRYEPVISYVTFTFISPKVGAIELNPITKKSNHGEFAKFRNRFNRKWRLRRESQITEFESAVITGIDGLEPYSSSEKAEVIKSVVVGLWEKECQQNNSIIQMGVTKDLEDQLKESFSDWNYIATPATLYRVSIYDEDTIETAAVRYFETKDESVLDVSIL